MKALIVAEGKHEQGGALKTLVCRLNASVVDCSDERLARSDIHAHHGTGRGYYKKAVRWMREAEKQGFDAIVLLVDEDGHTDRRSEIAEAQLEKRITRIKRAMGVAIRTFDAWMLADERALTQALGRPVSRQQAPESVADPKDVCRALLAGCASPVSQSEAYAAVARLATLAILAERCPVGFAPFAERVRSL